jgi:FkbM family methyltransferase
LAKINEMPTSDNFLVNVWNGSMTRIGKIFHNPYRKVNIGPVFLKYLKHIPSGKLHSHKLFGHETWFVSGQEYLHGIKEIFIEEIYKQTLPANAFILDCGANIGLSAIYLKKICPTARIIAFEPDVNNFNLLQKNIASHGLQDIELKNEAVWKEEAMISFESEGTMSSKIAFNQEAGASKLTKAVRLKNYLNRKIDFLKIDIEGAEYQVLCDISDHLNFVHNLFVEYHGMFGQMAELSELFDLFSKKGFRYYIKEATVVYQTPFVRKKKNAIIYDIQLNIFCFRDEAH